MRNSDRRYEYQVDLIDAHPFVCTSICLSTNKKFFDIHPCLASLHLQTSGVPSLTNFSSYEESTSSPTRGLFFRCKQTCPKYILTILDLRYRLAHVWRWTLQIDFWSSGTYRSDTECCPHFLRHWLGPWEDLKFDLNSSVLIWFEGDGLIENLF